MASQDLPDQLRVVSLNCWGLKFLSAHRHARLSQIGHELAKAAPPADIVALQECWTQADYNAIREATSQTLPHGKYYHSGIFGGGLVILSRFPIEESSMHKYSLNGRPTAFFRGDWFVGKGVACATLRIGPGEDDLLEILNTHLHAPYEREPNDSYICHRTAQAWEIARLARDAQRKRRPVLALGDFNMVPASLAHRIVRVHGGLQDVWQSLHPDSSVGAAEDSAEKSRGRPVPTIESNLSENGTTCDSAANTWRWPKDLQKQLDKGNDVPVDHAEQDNRAKRLDYIFTSPDCHVSHAHVGMTMRHPVLRCSLSDHFSVEANLRLRRNGEESLSSGPSEGLDKPEPLDLHAPATEDFPRQHLLHPTIYAEVQHMIDIYNVRERRQRRLRLGHFVGSIVISIGCLVAVWWSPHNYVAFILMLLSTLGLSAGVIDGLIGGLFVGSELRALREFEWEVRQARSRAQLLTNVNTKD